MLHHNPTSSSLTPRQYEIAQLLSTTGLSYKKVADRIAVSRGTLRKHVENIYRSLGVHSRAELMIALSNRHSFLTNP